MISMNILIAILATSYISVHAHDDGASHLWIVRPNSLVQVRYQFYNSQHFFASTSPTIVLEKSFKKKIFSYSNIRTMMAMQVIFIMERHYLEFRVMVRILRPKSSTRLLVRMISDAIRFPIPK